LTEEDLIFGSFLSVQLLVFGSIFQKSFVVLLDLFIVGSDIFKLLLVNHQKLTSLIVLFLKLIVFYLLCAQFQLNSVELLPESFFSLLEFVKLKVKLGSDVGVGHLDFLGLLGDNVVGDIPHLRNFFLMNLNTLLQLILQPFCQPFIAFNFSLQQLVLLLKADRLLSFLCQFFFQRAVLLLILPSADHSS
jgi:hypothetical protein